MDKKSLIQKIKEIFEGPAEPVVAAAAEPVSYAVDGGVPVFVDISDDGIPDIDTGDPVYSDAAMTMPYADGTYTVTGTQFGFVVAGGVVASVADPAGSGPGAPSTAVVDPVTVDAAAAGAPPVVAELSTDEKVNAFDARLKAIEAQLTEMKTKMGAFEKAQPTAAEFAEAQKFETMLTEIDKNLKMLVTIPEVAPKTLSEGEKTKFDRAAKKKSAIDRVAGAVSQIEGAKRY